MSRRLDHGRMLRLDRSFESATGPACCCSRSSIRVTSRLCGSILRARASSCERQWNDPDRRTCLLRVVNRLFGEQSYPFEPAYPDFVRKRYGAPIEPVDFRNAPETRRARIDEWVEAQTMTRIRDLVRRRPRGGRRASLRTIPSWT